MSSLIAPRNAIEYPVRTLVILWAIYKAIILLIAIPTPGPGYDTSTHLYEHQISKDAETCGWLACFLTTISKNLTRWDALYFTRVARKGYEVEQYWAFGWGWTQLIHYFSSDLRASSLGSYAFVESFVGIVIAHVAHLLSVLALYKMTKEIFTGPSGTPTISSLSLPARLGEPSVSGPVSEHSPLLDPPPLPPTQNASPAPDIDDPPGNRLAFICAALHIVAPGGVFLSAPYGESTTSFLCFLGMIFVVKSFPLFDTSSFMHDFSMLIAGIIFGLATMVRSNAILYGVLLLEEALRLVWSLKDGITYQKIRRGVFTGVGGICIAIGFAYPQWIAYNQFCYPDPTARPWCQETLPSIYTFVQEWYWDVGFLRYWRGNHIPLFTLAAPMITILMLSARWTFGLGPAEHTKPSYKVDHYRTTDKEKAMAMRTVRILQSLAYPQVFLGVMAVFCYHVQIITRIGSAYPLGYFWIGTSVIEWSKRKKAQATVRVRVEGRGKTVKRSFGEWWKEEWPMVAVCYCVMYGLIQAVLYASFLPPA